MDCFIHLHRILKLEVTMTVTGQKTWKKYLSRGHQSNNLLLHYPHVKQNTLLLHRVCVMQYG
jgi:hypothetical protein